MTKTRNIFWILLAVTFSWAFAQEDSIIDRVDTEALGRGETVARVTLADKHSFIRREGAAEEEMLRNMAVISGDLIETRHKAYAEVEFIDGSLLQIADKTAVEFQAINEVFAEESLTVMKLHDGSLFLHTTDVAGNLNRRVIRIDTASGSAYVEAPGIYRIDMKGSRMSLRTYRGFAELAGANDSAPIYSGEYATIRHMKSPSRVRPFNSFQYDRFERWAYDRRPVSSVSSKYVDASVSAYARDLDDHGSWRYEEDVRKHVWVPYVDAGWRPYNRGYWSNCGPYMTWVSYDPFGYLTHHYGRWMWRASLGWYWVPGYRYSPAWVAWSWHDNWLGWCPLNYWDEPYYYYNYGRRGGTSVRVRNVTVVNNYWNYVPANAVVNRRRNYTITNNVVVNGPRRITTRRLHVQRDDFGSATRLSRVVNDPVVNRRRAQSTRSTTGTLFASGTRTRGAVNNSRVRIESRSTGTTAPSRLAGTVRRSSSTTTTSTTRTLRRPDYNGINNTRTTEPYGESVRDTGDRGTRGVVRTERSATRTESSRSRAGGTPPKRSTDSRATTTRSNGNSSRATSRTTTRRNESRTTTRSNTTRSNESRATPRSNTTRGNQSYTPPKRSNSNRSNATRSNNTRGNQSYTPPKRSNSNRSNATRSNNSRSTRSYTPPKRSSSSRSSATSGSRNTSRSSATRSSSARSAPRSSGTTTTRSSTTRSSSRKNKN